ncbi:MAG: protease pro-enzyme activation domain-containing protein, partial [Candidatus Sulfotelmatobacter sp.]
QPTAALPQPLITQAVSEAQLTVLKGNTHPLARPQFDLGTAPATLPMQRMLLVLKRSPAQESALRKLLDDQQDKHSPSYHQWLTPTQYGKQFGPTDSDLQTITTWLQSHGFQVGTTKGRTVLEFSGSASQVQQAFHTAIHKYVVNGEQHWANSSDPQIPTALTPAVAGVLTLHNFFKRPLVRYTKQTVPAKIRPGKRPAITFGDGSHGLAPLDFATIYSSNAYSTTTPGPTGAGVTIGVVGRSNLFNGGEDVSDFDSGQIFDVSGGTFSIILNGADPGDLGGGEETEATLDSTWTGAVAPGANVELVVSASTNTTDGVDLSELYIIENNFADIMTESFDSCEAEDTNELGVTALAEQAAAQGITYFVSTGDAGAEGCDDPNSETVATGPVSVNILAATPFNTAVGGTVFDDTANPTLYWSSTNTGQESAISYIPEDVWNDSCAASSCGSNANIAASGGGVSTSTIFGKPSWQSGVTGIPADNARDIPDVSLSAAPHDGYVLCLDASCVPDSSGEFFLFLIGGTSASAPSFAGIMAQVDEQMATLNPTNGPRQGVAGYVLYRLAATENATLTQCNGSSTTLPVNTCIFHDVTVGNNAVPGEVNYGSPTAQYQAGVGYDLASGLGSVNINNLVTQWNSVTFSPSTTTLVLNNNVAVNIIHGQSVTGSVTVAQTTGSVVPTGDVVLMTSNTLSPSTLDLFSLAGGAAAFSTTQLPGDGPSPTPTSYNVWAHYGGDGTFAPSDSNLVPVTVATETSTTVLSVLGFDSNGNQFNFSSGPFGSFVYLRADVKGQSNSGRPTGAVTFTDTFGAIPGGGTFALNSGDAPTGIGPYTGGSDAATPNGVTFDAGSHSVSASYAGDPSFAASSTGAQSFTITPGFFASIPSNLAGISISAPGSSGSTSMTVANSSNFSGTISLACSGLPAEATCAFSPASIAASGTAATTTVTVTVSTTAPHTTQNIMDRPYYFAGLMMGSSLALGGVFVLGFKKPQQRAALFMLMVVGLLVVIPACGGGGSKPTPTPVQDPGTPAGTYNVTVTATSGSVSSITGFTLFLQ